MMTLDAEPSKSICDELTETMLLSKDSYSVSVHTVSIMYVLYLDSIKTDSIDE